MVGTIAYRHRDIGIADSGRYYLYISGGAAACEVDLCVGNDGCVAADGGYGEVIHGSLIVPDGEVDAEETGGVCRIAYHTADSEGAGGGGYAAVNRVGGSGGIDNDGGRAIVYYARIESDGSAGAFAGAADIAAGGGKGAFCVTNGGKCPLGGLVGSQTGCIHPGAFAIGPRASLRLIVVGQAVGQAAGGVVEVDLIGAAEIIICISADDLDGGAKIPGGAESADGAGLRNDDGFSRRNKAKAGEIVYACVTGDIIEAPACHIDGGAAYIGEFDKFSIGA